MGGLPVRLHPPLLPAGRPACLPAWLAGWPEQKQQLCVNRTQRHSETLAILLSALSQEIKVRETLLEAG